MDWSNALGWSSVLVTAVISSLGSHAVDWGWGAWAGLTPPSAGASCPTIDVGALAGHEQVQVWLRQPNGKICWSSSLDDVNTGDQFEVLVGYSNGLPRASDNVTVQSFLPPGFDLVAGSTTVANTTNPDGLKVSDHISSTGINVGNYGSHAGAWIKYSVRVTGLKLECRDGLSVLAVSARLVNASEEDSGWVSSAIVQAAAC